jgi:hypothetical protein
MSKKIHLRLPDKVINTTGWHNAWLARMVSHCFSEVDLDPETQWIRLARFSLAHNCVFRGCLPVRRPEEGIPGHRVPERHRVGRDDHGARAVPSPMAPSHRGTDRTTRAGGHARLPTESLRDRRVMGIPRAGAHPPRHRLPGDLLDMRIDVLPCQEAAGRGDVLLRLFPRPGRRQEIRGATHLRQGTYPRVVPMRGWDHRPGGAYLFTFYED